jgi:hypothetical protein
MNWCFGTYARTHAGANRERMEEITVVVLSVPSLWATIKLSHIALCAILCTAGSEGRSCDTCGCGKMKHFSYFNKHVINPVKK